MQKVSHLSTRVAKYCICTVTYVYHEMSIYIFFMYIFHMKMVSKNNWVPDPALGSFPGSANTSFTLTLVWCTWHFVAELPLGLEHSWASSLVHFLSFPAFTSSAVLCLGACCCSLSPVAYCGLGAQRWHSGCSRSEPVWIWQSSSAASV